VRRSPDAGVQLAQYSLPLVGSNRISKKLRSTCVGYVILKVGFPVAVHVVSSQSIIILYSGEKDNSKLLGQSPIDSRPSSGWVIWMRQQSQL
jgi:hypothetical protein